MSGTGNLKKRMEKSHLNNYIRAAINVVSVLNNLHFVCFKKIISWSIKCPHHNFLNQVDAIK